MNLSFTHLLSTNFHQLTIPTQVFALPSKYLTSKRLLLLKRSTMSISWFLFSPRAGNLSFLDNIFRTLSTVNTEDHE